MTKAQDLHIGILADLEKLQGKDMAKTEDKQPTVAERKAAWFDQMYPELKAQGWPKSANHTQMMNDGDNITADDNAEKNATAAKASK